MIEKYIDYTCLKPEACEEDIEELCKKAIEYRFASVCVNGCYTGLAANMLKDTGIGVATTIGFPLGANTPHIKYEEAKEAISSGATEIDMVINIGKLKDGDYAYVLSEINSVASLGATVKVIVEECLLSREELTAVCNIVAESDAQFIKTSSGFSKGGATLETVRLMKSIVGAKGKKVKAAGGIRDNKTAMEMIDAGADRIGASALLTD